MNFFTYKKKLKSAMAVRKIRIFSVSRRFYYQFLNSKRKNVMCDL